MDHVDVNLIRQLVSVEKYTYAQVSDYLKTKYPNSRGFSERTVRRYCEENEISSNQTVDRHQTKQLATFSLISLAAWLLCRDFKKPGRSNKINLAVLTRHSSAKVSWMENYKILCAEIRKDFITRALLRLFSNFQNSHKMCSAPFNCCFCVLLEANNFEKLKIKKKMASNVIQNLRYLYNCST